MEFYLGLYCLFKCVMFSNESLNDGTEENKWFHKVWSGQEKSNQNNSKCITHSVIKKQFKAEKELKEVCIKVQITIGEFQYSK